LRDAARIYEYWCYFTVAAAVGRILRRQPDLTRLTTTPLGTSVPHGYRAAWGDIELLYNATYSPKGAGGGHQRGRDSYSVRLRPDITLRAPSGRLHLFDAKLKVDFAQAIAGDDLDESPGNPDTFKRQDLYKMHAYRDALGADSVWILYPGTSSRPDSYAVPWLGTTSQPFEGVGAVALRPGKENDGGLQDLLAELLGSAGEPRLPIRVPGASDDDELMPAHPVRGATRSHASPR
jgi:predicted component of viral defense system (DUF524 family)